MANTKKILIIEDDQYARDIYQEVLTEAGFDITTAVDGEEGLTKLKEGEYSLVLLDMMMPKRDGLGVLEGLKESPSQHPLGTIILLTNLAHDPVINKALSLGAKGYLIKSDLNPDQLVAKVQEFLKTSD